MENTEEIRARLKEGVTYDEGQDLRAILHQNAVISYRQKYSDTDHINFMERHEVSLEREHPQSTNFPYYFHMFSVITQHLRGDCVRELLDKAIAIEEMKAIKHSVDFQLDANG